MKNPFKRGEKQVKIVPNQDFLHGRARFEKGQKYQVEQSLARYFERNGWLEGDFPEPPPIESLDIDNGKLGQSGGL